MSYLHLFNPGHETAILHGSENYTPSRNVQRMTRELATLPMWYADGNDFVYTEKTDFASWIPDGLAPVARPVSAESLLNGKNRLPLLQVKPWGLSPHSCGFFKRLVQQGVSLITPEWKEVYKQLTGRQTAACCLERLKQLVPEIRLPEVPCFCSSIQEVRTYMKVHEHADFVLKSPFSSSGRGVLWIKHNQLGIKEEQWISGILKKQGTFSIEPALHKVRDFAMEFYSDGKGTVRYEGVSLFSTAELGAYSGNLLGRQEYLLQQLLQYNVEYQFELFREKLQEVLSEVYASKYEGYLGVDMLLYLLPDDPKPRIHPCIEINMRYTMGIVALQLSRKLLAEQSAGHFVIAFNRKPGDTYQYHLQMQERYPLNIKEGKIVSGYLPLCPVGPETGYIAYVKAEEKEK